ncbi:hypothetical protein B7767_12920 [Streptomyces sp. 13-12-16]|uniref:hypothetical protein n=2 Tax=unclassified Streptomyces TaxID=2593676 RepID=UPI000A1F9729|nr:hypothetical protein [Streptomyces sp. 13-12-16]OSP42930.1 hypothetical protein B7767_12920 [Streptomyces sp. 13-12-16]
MTHGFLLYARARTVPRTVLVLVATAALAVLGARNLNAYLDPARQVPVVALAPLFAAAVIGTSLHSASEELDRTAVRPWWRRRLVHLLALTGCAALLLAATVLGPSSPFGPSAMVRNTLGCTGLTAGAVAVLGARLSWLPVFGYVSAVYVGSASARGTLVPVWAWPVQPAGRHVAWVTAGVLLVAGTALYVVRGARPEGRRG